MRGPDSDKIRLMFNNIAGDYDKLNHLFSLGVDKSWRRRALKWIVEPDKKQSILDVACGTGDFSIAIAEKADPATVVTGMDLSDGMLEVMSHKVRKAGLTDRIVTAQGNCEHMPFADDSFDRVTVAFGIRNFQNREAGLTEMLRVLKPGGSLVILELSVPSNKFVRLCYNFYFTRIMPSIGGLVSGDKAAYKYLPASVLKFPGKEEWMATMTACGYKSVMHKSFTFGICRMYVGWK